MSLPEFCIDGEHRAALVVGRGAELGPLSGDQIRACVAVAAEHAARTGLPLVFVIAAASDTDDAYAGAAAGLLVAHAEQDRAVEVSRALLDASPSSVPASFWDALRDAGADFPAPTEDDDPEYPREGLFLVPGGWSIATLWLGAGPSPEEIAAAEDAGELPPESQAERLLSVAAEDGDAACVVSAEVLARVEASSEPLMLEAMYC